jgi:hypothetical protein
MVERVVPQRAVRVGPSRRDTHERVSRFRLVTDRVEASRDLVRDLLRALGWVELRLPCAQVRERTDRTLGLVLVPEDAVQRGFCEAVVRKAAEHRVYLVPAARVALREVHRGFFVGRRARLFYRGGCV